MPGSAGSNGDGSINASVNAGGVSAGTGGVSVAGVPVGGALPGAGSSSAGGSTAGGSTAGTGGIAGGGSGVMTAAERVAVLDGALNRGYEDFDGLILEERSRAQRQSNEVGSDPAGLYGPGDFNDGIPGIAMPGQPGGSSTGADGGSGLPAGVIVSNGGEGPQTGGSGGSVGGLRGGPASDAEGAFPVPEDIPDGRNDDVVARQIREAAMKEPDPELRERLWDEYRRYTGISQ